MAIILFLIQIIPSPAYLITQIVLLFLIMISDSRLSWAPELHLFCL